MEFSNFSLEFSSPIINIKAGEITHFFVTRYVLPGLQGKRFPQYV